MTTKRAIGSVRQVLQKDTLEEHSGAQQMPFPSDAINSHHTVPIFYTNSTYVGGGELRLLTLLTTD